MAEAYDRTSGAHEDPAAGPSWIIAIISGVLVVVIFLGVAALLRRTMVERDERLLGTPVVTSLGTIRARDAERLEGPVRWVEELGDDDEVTRRLVIPIERAMDIVAGELESAPTTPTNVPTPEPAPAE